MQVPSCQVASLQVFLMNYDLNISPIPFAAHSFLYILLLGTRAVATRCMYHAVKNETLMDGERSNMNALTIKWEFRISNQKGYRWPRWQPQGISASGGEVS